MTSAAIVASLRELEKVRGAGRSLTQQHAANVNRAEAIQTAIAHKYAVRDYIPRADASSHTNAALTSADGRPAPLEWRWGQLGDVTYRALDEAIRCQVASLLEGMGSDVPDPVVVTRAGMTFHVHGARAAFGSFVSHLRDKGIKAIEDAVDKHAR